MLVVVERGLCNRVEAASGTVLVGLAAGAGARGTNGADLQEWNAEQRRSCYNWWNSG